MRSMLLAVVFALMLFGCSKPLPPTIAPQRVDIVLTEAAGPLFRVQASAHSPNSYALPLRSVSAKLAFVGRDAGQVTATSVATLAARADTPISFDVQSTWPQIIGLLPTLGGGDEVPYTVTGTASFQAAGLTLEVAFSTGGTVRKSELTAAATRGLIRPNILFKGKGLDSMIR